jgi:hypothetical protein
MPNKTTCVACAEEILEAARLCKHCGTLQSDPRFVSSTPNAVDQAPELTANPEELAAIEWFTSYEFVRYVDAGSEEDLAKVDTKKIWTHYADGLNGEFVTNGLLPEYDYVHGYYEMKKSWEFEENTEFIQVLEFTECADCEDGYDENGDYCAACDGGQISYLASFFE